MRCRFTHYSAEMPNAKIFFPDNYRTNPKARALPSPTDPSQWAGEPLPVLTVSAGAAAQLSAVYASLVVIPHPLTKKKGKSFWIRICALKPSLKQTAALQTPLWTL